MKLTITVNKRIWDKAYSFKSDLTGATLTNLKIEKADN